LQLSRHCRESYTVDHLEEDPVGVEKREAVSDFEVGEIVEAIPGTLTAELAVAVEIPEIGSDAVVLGIGGGHLDTEEGIAGSMSVCHSVVT